jgi:dihydroflavonol-4-reductase
MSSRTVVVTGASGYIAKHIVLELLQAGRAVRGTVRSRHRADEVEQAIRGSGPDGDELAGRLSFAMLDIEQDDGWSEAMAGADALIHTASPFPMVQPKDPDMLIRPAVDGTRRALEAARRAGIERVVLTSSVAAVVYGPAPAGRPYDERDWTDTSDRSLSPYIRSKTLAERAAWDYVDTTGQGMRLTVVNPGLVLGAPLDAHFGTSLSLVQRMLLGKDPAVPRVQYAIVDVRDVARMHVAALETPAAEGRRFLAVGGMATLPEIARWLKAGYPRRRIVTREAPDLLLRALGLFDKSISTILPDLGKRFTASNAAAREVLGIDFADPHTSVRRSAEFLIARGLA